MVQKKARMGYKGPELFKIAAAHYRAEGGNKALMSDVPAPQRGALPRVRPLAAKQAMAEPMEKPVKRKRVGLKRRGIAVVQHSIRHQA